MTQKKKQEINNIIKSIFLGIVASIIVTMSLLSFPFKRYSKELIAHKKKYQSIIYARDNVQDSLKKELGKSLTIAEYKKLSTESWFFHRKELQEYTRVKKVLMRKQSFLGRTNFKFWLTQFGIILLGLYFSIKSLFNDYKQKIKTGHQYISNIGVLVCLFWLYHLFFKTAADFYNETYVFVEIVLCVIATFFVSNLIKYYAKRESVIKHLISLVLRIKTTHYKNMLVKALYAEKHDKSIDSIETVKSQSEKFDTDIKETIDKALG